MAKIIRAIKSNQGIRLQYQRRLSTLLDEMQASFLWWVRAAYRRNEARIVAEDASPARELRRVLRRLTSYWRKRWEDASEDIATQFVQAVDARTSNSLFQAVKAAGFTIRFPRSRAQNDTVQSLIEWNVSLIKSIATDYLDEVNSLVMRSATEGRDVGYLASELGSRYDITKRRAKMIARDQSNKATEAIKRTASDALGITEGIWVHVPGVKTSRETHQRMDGKRFKLNEGIYDSDVKRKVLPGELPLCQCTYRAVIPEFGD